MYANDVLQPAGVAKDACTDGSLAAINANPWQQSSPAPYYPPQPYPGDY
jgi:hypothetical protein